MKKIANFVKSCKCSNMASVLLFCFKKMLCLSSLITNTLHSDNYATPGAGPFHQHLRTTLFVRAQNQTFLNAWYLADGSQNLKLCHNFDAIIWCPLYSE